MRNYTEPRRGLAAGAAHPAEPAVRRERSADRPRRPDLHRAGDRQPDQRPRHRDRRAGNDQRQGRRHHRARTTWLSTRAATFMPPRSWTVGSARAAPTAAPGCCATMSRPPTESRSIRAGCSSASAGAGGRILELDLGGGPPRVLLENVPSPNAMEVGPDGLLYFPVMGANEIGGSTWTAVRPKPSPPASACRIR